MVSPDLPLGDAPVVAARPDGERFVSFAYPGSVVLLPSGRLMAVFTGRPPRGPCRAVAVTSADGGRTWSAPEVLFGGELLSVCSTDLGEGYADPNLVIVDERRVLAFCVSLRYDEKVWDLSRTRFWCRRSSDGGRTFGPVEEMPRQHQYYVGTVHPGLRLRCGTLIMGYSWDKPAEVGRPAGGEGTMDLVSGALISRDEGLTWPPGGDCYADTARAADALSHATNGLDEPAIVELADGTLFLLGRTGTHHLWQSRSRDGGVSWEAPQPSPLTSHNCPAALLRLRGSDDVLAVFNHHPRCRLNLSVARSADGCRTWGKSRRIGPVGAVSEQAEASYPNLCQLADGTVVAVFGQIDRGDPASCFSIMAVRFDPSAVE